MATSTELHLCLLGGCQDVKKQSERHEEAGREQKETNKSKRKKTKCQNKTCPPRGV